MAALEYSDAAIRTLMKDIMYAPCSECGGEVKSRSAMQGFEREGVRVEVSGTRALACSKCGEIYFAPGGAQAVVEAANSLFELARKNRQHRGKLVAKASRARRVRKVVVA